MAIRRILVDDTQWASPKPAKEPTIALSEPATWCQELRRRSRPTTYASSAWPKPSARFSLISPVALLFSAPHRRAQVHCLLYPRRCRSSTHSSATVRSAETNLARRFGLLRCSSRNTVAETFVKIALGPRAECSRADHSHGEPTRKPASLPPQMNRFNNSSLEKQNRLRSLLLSPSPASCIFGDLDRIPKDDVVRACERRPRAPPSSCVRKARPRPRDERKPAPDT